MGAWEWAEGTHPPHQGLPLVDKQMDDRTTWPMSHALVLMSVFPQKKSQAETLTPDVRELGRGPLVDGKGLWEVVRA